MTATTDAVVHPASGARITDRAQTWLVAAVATGALLAVAGRYGYHRDELYFLFVCSGPRGGWDALWPALKHT